MKIKELMEKEGATSKEHRWQWNSDRKTWSCRRKGVVVTLEQYYNHYGGVAKDAWTLSERLDRIEQMREESQ